MAASARESAAAARDAAEGLAAGGKEAALRSQLDAALAAAEAAQAEAAGARAAREAAEGLLPLWQEKMQRLTRTRTRT